MSPEIDTTILYICQTCGMPKDASGTKQLNPVSAELATATAKLLESHPVEVRLTACLSLCSKPIAWGLQSPVRHATTFAPATTAEDLAASALAYINTPIGTKMPKKLLPPDVIPTLISRLPPLK